MSDEPSVESKEVKNLNRWLIALVIFVTIWSLGIFVYVGQKVEVPATEESISALVVGGYTGKIVSTSYTNLFALTQTNKNGTVSTNEIAHYEHRDVYKKLDFVIIDHFFIEGIVVDKSGDNYTVLYKDRNRSLQRIIVPKTLLLIPAPSTWVNPYELKGE